MGRRFRVGAFVASIIVFATASLPDGASEVRLARQPDYHAGRIAFGYLGDI